MVVNKLYFTMVKTCYLSKILLFNFYRYLKNLFYFEKETNYRLNSFYEENDETLIIYTVKNSKFAVRSELEIIFKNEELLTQFSKDDMKNLFFYYINKKISKRE